MTDLFARFRGENEEAPDLMTRAPEPLEGEADSRLLLGAPERPAIGPEEVRRATELLQKYKAGKANLEARIIEDEEWYRMRHWDVIRRRAQAARKPLEDVPNPTSAWLFNAIMNKHADLMDNVPEIGVLPREAGDGTDAKTLSSVLPCILERNEFEDTYSKNGWEKLKHGTTAYFVGWNPQLENGLGDIDIHALDLLNVYWEPGITDIQDSASLFIVALKDNDALKVQYPDLRPGNVVEIAKYVYDDAVDTTDKSVVVDWYYRVRLPSGKTVLHLAKFVGDSLLFASQNDPQYAQTGWYEHGMYPVVLDALYPEKGTPAGFGLVSIVKDPQMYIDRLGGCILENAMQGTNPRYFISENTGINEQEMNDPSKRFVHVAGTSLDDAKLRAIQPMQLNGNYVSVLQLKIDELKETSSNRDVTSGGASAGVTAASAIAALQEAGNKTSRDMISGSYRAFSRLGYLCIELIRQFYDETRTFRITGEDGYDFQKFSNENLRDQQVPGYENMVRRPIFDIRVKAQKKNPFSRAIQNELGKELYRMGFFVPDKAQEALGALELMEFEGRDKVREYIAQGQTLLSAIQKMSAQMQQMAGMMGLAQGDQGGAQGAPGQGVPGQGTPGIQTPGARGAQNHAAAARSHGGGGGKNPLADAAEGAQTIRQTPYAQALAARSRPDMNRQNGVTAP